MENVQTTVTICAGFDGGIIIYESAQGESRLVFGGDHEAATKYLASRMARLIDENAKEPGVFGFEDQHPAPVVAKPVIRSTKLADRLARIDEVTDH